MTSQQIQFFHQMYPNGIYPTGDQTQEQAVNLAVTSFQYACSLEGVTVPSDSEVREVITNDAKV